MQYKLAIVKVKKITNYTYIKCADIKYPELLFNH